MVLFSAPVIPICTPVSARVLVVMVVSVPGPRPLFVVLSELIHFIMNYINRNQIRELVNNREVFAASAVVLNLSFRLEFLLRSCPAANKFGLL